MNSETLQCVAVMSHVLISRIYIVANDLFQSLFDGCAKRRADLLMVSHLMVYNSRLQKPRGPTQM